MPLKKDKKPEEVEQVAVEAPPPAAEKKKAKSAKRDDSKAHKIDDALIKNVELDVPPTSPKSPKGTLSKQNSSVDKKNGGSISRRQGSASKTRRSRIPRYRGSGGRRLAPREVHSLITKLTRETSEGMRGMFERYQMLHGADRPSLITRQATFTAPRQPLVIHKNLDATLNLKNQFVAKLRSEREKCAQLELQNRTLMAQIRKLEADISRKLNPAGSSRLHQMNQATYWRNKLKDMAQQKDQTQKLLSAALKNAEQEAERNDKLLKQIEEYRNQLHHLSSRRKAGDVDILDLDNSAAARKQRGSIIVTTKRRGSKDSQKAEQLSARNSKTEVAAEPTPAPAKKTTLTRQNTGKVDKKAAEPEEAEQPQPQSLGRKSASDKPAAKPAAATTPDLSRQPSAKALSKQPSAKEVVAASARLSKGESQGKIPRQPVSDEEKQATLKAAKVKLEYDAWVKSAASENANAAAAAPVPEAAGNAKKKGKK